MPDQLWAISFGQLSGYIVFCTVPIGGAKPLLCVYVKRKIQCSQKVGQKKWSHNLYQSWEAQPTLSLAYLLFEVYEWATNSVNLFLISGLSRFLGPAIVVKPKH